MNDRQGLVFGTGHELQGGLGDSHERALGADCEPCHVKSVRIEKLVEVVPGHPALNLGESPEDLVSASLPYTVETPVDVSFEAQRTAFGVE